MERALTGASPMTRRQRATVRWSTWPGNQPRPAPSPSAGEPLRRTGRSIAQPGSPCDEDPALPVLFALISH